MWRLNIDKNKLVMKLINITFSTNHVLLWLFLWVSRLRQSTYFITESPILAYSWVQKFGSTPIFVHVDISYSDTIISNCNSANAKCFILCYIITSPFLYIVFLINWKFGRRRDNKQYTWQTMLTIIFNLYSACILHSPKAYDTVNHK